MIKLNLLSLIVSLALIMLLTLSLFFMLKRLGQRIFLRRRPTPNLEQHIKIIGTFLLIYLAGALIYLGLRHLFIHTGGLGNVPLLLLFMFTVAQFHFLTLHFYHLPPFERVFLYGSAVAASPFIWDVMTGMQRIGAP